MATERKQWIVNGGQLTLRHPYQLSQVTAFSFALRADLGALSRLCDRTLNLGGPLEYHPIAPIVLATFMRAERVSSLYPDDAQKGFLQETELSFTIPLLSVHRRFGLSLPRSLVWHMPALWVDSGPILTAGREVYGYPKQLGRVTMPGGLNRPAIFQAEAETIRRYAQAEVAAFRPIASARRLDGESVEATVVSRLADAFLDFARQVFEHDLVLLRAANRIRKLAGKARKFWDRELEIQDPLVLAFLKQFPAIEGGNAACYQAVAEAPVRINGFRGAGLLAGDYEVEIPHYDSVNLAGALGLEGATASDGTLRCPVAFGFFADFDFSLNAGRLVHVKR
jgi:hypothetical protein